MLKNLIMNNFDYNEIGTLTENVMTVTKIFTMDELSTFDLEHGLPDKTSPAMRKVLIIGELKFIIIKKKN